MNSNHNFGRRWGKEEEAIVKRLYPTTSAKELQRILKNNGYERSVNAIQHRASKHMIWRGEIEGYIAVSKIAKAGSRQYYQILFNACRDGVLKENERTYAFRYFVPEEWAIPWFDLG